MRTREFDGGHGRKLNRRPFPRVTRNKIGNPSDFKARRVRRRLEIACKRAGAAHCARDTGGMEKAVRSDLRYYFADDDCLSFPSLVLSINTTLTRAKAAPTQAAGMPIDDRYAPDTYATLACLRFG
jgi:hypothetical protein